MTLIDANLLLYAINRDAPQHERARQWLEARLSGSEPVGFAWVVLLAVLRIATSPRVFPRPLSPEAALELVQGWLAQPCSVLVNPGPAHWPLLRQLIVASGTAANLCSDAHLAALALERGATLASCDNDFRRFAGLLLLDPLAEGRG